MLGVILVAATACGESLPQPVSVTSVMGCYVVTDSLSHRLGKTAGFWAAPVRLDTVREPGDGEAGEVAEPGDYVAVTMAPV